MKTSDFALFGAQPKFTIPVPVGQLYFPSWERYEAAFHGIFERQYYNNNGPLHEELEDKLRDFFGVRHVVLVTNATLGLMMVADALELSGKVILPAFTFVASAQSLTWAGLDPIFCDIDPDTHQIDLNAIGKLMRSDVSAIMGVNLWGGSCDPHALAEIATSQGIQLYFDSAHAFGCEVEGRRVGGFGRAEVFSFHATKILNATEGGCICTNDDEVASRLQAMRPSYGCKATAVSVLRVANARMSEGQAAVALMSLEDFEANRQNNEDLYRRYEARLAMIPGLRLVRPTGVSLSNYQYLVCTVDEQTFGLSRDLLIELLRAENILARRYFYPGLHRTIPYVANLDETDGSLANTNRACATSIQLPIGALVSPEIVDRISEIINIAHDHAPDLRSRHDKK